jgi:hypothetical protein
MVRSSHLNTAESSHSPIVYNHADRTAQEVAKLTYSDMVELLQMKSQWRRDMEKMMTERANREEQHQHQQQETTLLMPEDAHQPTSVFTHEICT